MAEPRFPRRNLLRMLTIGATALVSGRAFAQAFDYDNYQQYVQNYFRQEDYRLRETVPQQYQAAYNASFHPNLTPNIFDDPVLFPRPATPTGGCFAKGTRIGTPWGWRYVESLRVGEQISTIDGTAKITGIDHQEAETIVRIARDALGDDIPDTDLWITGGHALWIDGALVTAEQLINGRNITLHHGSFDTYHIQLKHHDIVYANNTPCESMLEVRNGELTFAQAKLAWQRLQRRSLVAR
jgi:hypothetical protein